jgi:hypothetical protein
VAEVQNAGDEAAAMERKQVKSKAMKAEMAHRSPQSKRKAQKPRLARRKAQKPRLARGNALLRIPAPANKPWELNRAEIELVKGYICKGATDKELEFCLAVARRRKLDPFRQQIWFVPRKDRMDGQEVKRWIPITGIDGLLHIAARDHKDFGSNDEPEFGPMKEVKWQYYDKSGKFQAPEWARVKVWKKGHEHPVIATVYWDEVYRDVGASPLVRQMPRLMLGKCALAQAVRRAYPATDGLYIREELQGPPQYTDTGREIVYPAEALPEKTEDWCDKHGCDMKNCPSEEHTQEENEAWLARVQQQKLTPAQAEVVERKMAEAKEKSLMYKKLSNGSYEISGPDALKTALRDVLRMWYDAKSQKIFMPADVLSTLKDVCKAKNVPIKEVI